MYKKANKKLGTLSKIRMFITCNTTVKIYKTMIRPHLEYVDFVVESGSSWSRNWIDYRNGHFAENNIVKTLKSEENIWNLKTNIK